MFPSLMFLRSTRKRLSSGVLSMTRALRAERILNKFMIGLGAVLGLLGASVSVLESFFPGVL